MKNDKWVERGKVVMVVLIFFLMSFISDDIYKDGFKDGRIYEDCHKICFYYIESPNRFIPKNLQLCQNRCMYLIENMLKTYNSDFAELNELGLISLKNECNDEKDLINNLNIKYMNESNYKDKK